MNTVHIPKVSLDTISRATGKRKFPRNTTTEEKILPLREPSVSDVHAMTVEAVDKYLDKLFKEKE